MIPRDYVTQWRAHAPWAMDAQVEQDLVISRALVEFFRVPGVAGRLAFRGGTALDKLHLTPRGTPKTSISFRFAQSRWEVPSSGCGRCSIRGWGSLDGDSRRVRCT